MNVLALDTTTEPGSLALAQDGKLLQTALLPPGLRSTNLHLEIARLLERHGWAIGDVDGYAVTSGPGSFTGVRLGLTAVKGLAEVHRKPIAAVSTLETLAVAAQQSPELARPATVAAILDARRGQIFGGVYREQDGHWRAIIEESVSSLGSFLARIGSLMTANSLVESEALLKPAFCGIDLAAFVTEIEKAGWGGTRMIEVPPCLAGALAQVAVQRFQQGLGVEAARADANYVRLSDAELFWKE